MTTEKNTSFLSGTNLQFAWDSVSLGALKECPRKYQYTVIEGWEPRSRSTDLHFGILLHSARERYYRACAEGKDHDDALRAAVLWSLEETFDREAGKPWNSGDPNKNRLTLIRTLVWYCDTFAWAKDPLETIMLANGKPAVELSFRFDSGYDTPEGIPFVLCGHIDRLARWNDRVWISDLKSTKHTLDQSYFAGFSPDNQMSLYPLSAKIVYGEDVQGIIIDAAQVAVTFSRFQRGLIQRTAAQLDEWQHDLGFWLGQAMQYAREGYWPMNDKSCWRCAFRRVCSKSPGMREQWLQADFTKRIWDPLKVRGDI